MSADGDRNVVDGVKYITSGVSLGADGKDRVGATVIVDELVYTARDVAKVDARPGGYVVTGGHGGVVADLGGYAKPQVTFVPTRKHTRTSDLRLTALPERVLGVTGSLTHGVQRTQVAVKRGGELVPEAVPHVTITKYVRYPAPGRGSSERRFTEDEVEILARIDADLATCPLAGFICEGMSPFAMADPTRNAALAVAVFAGMPVVRTGRGNTGGMAYRTDPHFVAGNNLTSTKARILLMAGMLKLGSLPPASDPLHPTDEESASTRAAVARYQELFDSH